MIRALSFTLFKYVSSHLSLNYIYLRVCNSLAILNRHKSNMNSNLLGPKA